LYLAAIPQQFGAQGIGIGSKLHVLILVLLVLKDPFEFFQWTPFLAVQWQDIHQQRRATDDRRQAKDPHTFLTVHIKLFYPNDINKICYHQPKQGDQQTGQTLFFQIQQQHHSRESDQRQEQGRYIDK